MKLVIKFCALPAQMPSKQQFIARSSQPNGLIEYRYAIPRYTVGLVYRAVLLSVGSIAKYYYPQYSRSVSF